MSIDQVGDHGFAEHGYLPFDSPERLASMLVAWIEAHTVRDDGEPMAELLVRGPDGAYVGTARLSGSLVNELVNGLRREIAGQEAANAAGRRQHEMTEIIVTARRDGEDVGNLVAYSLAIAAERLKHGAARLVHGRPGSNEADTVVRWADYGGIPPAAGRGELLADLFYRMGEQKDDGGQVVSNALGYAARELGGLRALAGGSGWERDLWFMAHALNFEDEWQPGR